MIASIARSRQGDTPVMDGEISDIGNHGRASARLRRAVRLCAVLAGLTLAACRSAGDAVPPVTPAATPAAATPPADSQAGNRPDFEDLDPPEIATGFHAKEPVHARSFMAVTAHPLATRAARDVLADGGTAIDAAVAAQMVLNLVEPQSSGVGGGAFLLYYDANARAVHAYDGRETAPAAAGPNYLRYVDESGSRRRVLPSMRQSGRSVGVPGTVRMLELAHARHGRKPWKTLFQPAIRLAGDGFAISPRLSASIAGARRSLSRDPEAAAYFLNADGSAKAAGTLLKNPALAATFTAIANDGARAFYTGDIAQAIVDKVRKPATDASRPVVTGGLMTMQDLAGYQARRREPVCISYRRYEVCGMPPPSSGGIAVAQTLGILESFDMARYAPTDVDRNGGKPTAMGVHLFAEANRLAYADRNRYVADTDFVPLPGGSWNSLLDKAYLKRRAALIDPQRTLGTAPAGQLGPAGGSDRRGGLPETTPLSIVDRYGNVASMTSTIEGGFGSFHMARGFLLNNELTDFSPVPSDADGPIANRVQGGKRPRSTMAPTLVFHKTADGRRGEFVLATGSPGGAAIIQYVGKTLVANLDWGLDAQQAVSLPNFGSANGSLTYVEGMQGGVSDALLDGLAARGHAISRAAQTSGLGSIMRTRIDGRMMLVGGADPRRENLALGH